MSRSLPLLLGAVLMATPACAAPSRTEAASEAAAAAPCGADGELIAAVDLRASMTLNLLEPPASRAPAAGEARLHRATRAEGGRRRTTLTLCAADDAPLWRETVADIAADGSGYRSFSLTTTPGADGWAELKLHQTTLPTPGDSDFMPGPPLELVFRRGPDGRYERAR